MNANGGVPAGAVVGMYYMFEICLLWSKNNTLKLNLIDHTKKHLSGSILVNHLLNL